MVVASLFRRGFVLVLALLFVPVAAPARAQTAPPLHVTSCQVVPDTVGRRSGAVQEVIRVSFSVDKGAAADVARFSVSNPSGVYRDFTARGLFSHGVAIADRVLKADPTSQQQFYSLGASGGVDCALTYVHFVDGTSWAPAPPMQVGSCQIVPDTVAKSGPVQEVIRVAFGIEKGPPADVARFTVSTRAGNYPGFTARGTLGSGIAIADRIVSDDPAAQQRFYALSSDASVACSLSYVHFVDGTSWSAPGE